MKEAKIRAIPAGIVFTVTMSLLSGCAIKATPENLLRDMEKNAEKTKSAVLNFSMCMDMSGESGDISMGMNMDMETTTEPEAAHGTGTVSMGLSGMNFDIDTEIYSVIEDGEYVTYTLMEDQWTREVSDAGEITGEVDSMAENMVDYADYFELSKELVTVNGQDCFELTGELDGDIFAEFAGNDMLDSMTGYGLEEDTLSDMVFPCTIDIYQDSILPARVYFDMADTLASMLEDAGVSVSECYVDMTFMEYDSVGEITVPDEAR